MKKLALVALVAFAAVCAQAASVNWTYTSREATEKNATIYLIVGDTAPTSISNWSEWIADQTVVSQKTLSYNAIKGNTGSMESTSSDITTDKSYFFVMLDADGKNFKTTSTLDGANIVYDTAAQHSAIDTTISGTFGAWNEIKANTDIPSGDAPEPTSGLLLLVGAAALALKRKVA